MYDVSMLVMTCLNSKFSSEYTEHHFKAAARNFNKTMLFLNIKKKTIT